MVNIGEKIPEMELEALQGSEIRKIQLSDYRGKWIVLIFYPADFTFICPTELKEVAELYGEFRKMNAEVMSVSTDTVFVHKAWHETSPSINKVEFPMLADPTGKLCRDFGTYIGKEGISLRGSFIVDPDGILKAFELHDNSIGRNAKELLRKLQAASFVRESKGTKVCPASWVPGKDALTPNPGLIGRI